MFIDGLNHEGINITTNKILSTRYASSSLSLVPGYSATETGIIKVSSGNITCMVVRPSSQLV